jgi:hypothetical protein
MNIRVHCVLPHAVIYYLCCITFTNADCILQCLRRHVSVQGFKFLFIHLKFLKL